MKREFIVERALETWDNTGDITWEYVLRKTTATRAPMPAAAVAFHAEMERVAKGIEP